VAIFNLGFACYYFYGRRDRQQTALWTTVAAVFLIHAVIYLSGNGEIMAEGLRDFMDWVMNAVTYFIGAVVLFALFIRYRRAVTQPAVALGILDAVLLFSGWAMTDTNFQAIITKPDNVPIVLLIFSVGYFTWLAFRKATVNDERMAKGEPPLEKLED